MLQPGSFQTGMWHIPKSQNIGFKEVSCMRPLLWNGLLKHVSIATNTYTTDGLHGSCWRGTVGPKAGKEMHVCQIREALEYGCESLRTWNQEWLCNEGRSSFTLPELIQIWRGEHSLKIHSNGSERAQNQEWLFQQSPVAVYSNPKLKWQNVSFNSSCMVLIQFLPNATAQCYETLNPYRITSD
jgi:hypothetical protein